MGPFAAIRAHHESARITLLTTRPYAAFAAASPYFDEVWIDDKPKLWQFRRVLALRARLEGGRFDRVYDLQTSDRSSFYFRLLGGGTEWSGIARGCSHPHANPDRDRLHTLERQAEQLRQAGIADVPRPDLSWVEADIGRFNLPDRFVLLVAGGAPHRPGKRWPAAAYAALAGRLLGEGLTPVLLGTGQDRTQTETIVSACPEAVDLSERTSFPDIAALARKARGAVGNDTGPMHLIAAAGCPSLVLYSRASDPALCAQRGEAVSIVRTAVLDALPVDEVRAALRLR
ncbi:MAG: glycosyltransferase family 9 protein [Alphaproteobacteria bacterium]|nr:glycosyltransferase family 9 protein [Alphaproteobacteria bacterium]